MTQASLGNVDPALARAWHPVATSGQLMGAGEHPLRVMLLGEPWAIARLDGTLLAVPDRCPHRRVPLSAGRVIKGELECCYHGWRFDASGACTTVPALGPGTKPPPGMQVSPAFGITERYGLVWLAPQEPLAGLPVLPECDDPAFAWALLPERSTTASAGLVIDNFFDVAHFSYLHGVTFGVSDPVTVDELTVSREAWQATAVHATRIREDLGGLRRVATYTMTAPFAMHLRLCFPTTGASTMVAFIAVPSTARETIIRKLVAWPLTEGPAALAEQVSSEVTILEEDLRVLELIETTSLPLDLRSELHTRADRPSVELRRLLRDFCEAAGC